MTILQRQNYIKSFDLVTVFEETKSVTKSRLHCIKQTLMNCTTSYPIINYCETHIKKSPTWWKVSQKLLSVIIHRCAQKDVDDISCMFNQNKDESSGNLIANWADTAFNNCSRLWKLVHKSYLAASLILWNYNLDKGTLRKFLLCFW